MEGGKRAARVLSSAIRKAISLKRRLPRMHGQLTLEVSEASIATGIRTTARPIPDAGEMELEIQLLINMRGMHNKVRIGYVLIHR